MNSKMLAPWALLFGIFVTRAPAEVRMWTSSKDPTKVFAGELVGFHGDEITVRRADGQTITFALDLVTAEDRAYAKAKAPVLLPPDLTEGELIPAPLRSRCSEKERAAMRLRYGGSDDSDASIKKALFYLKGKQNEDGSWGETYKAAMTGFSLLCYLGECITPDHPEYGDTVTKGLLFLAELHNSGKRIFATSTDHGQSYEHAIVTCALGEAYILTRFSHRKIPILEAAFKKGIEIIIDGQNPDGGWTYGYPARGASDTSVTGWQIQAFRAAKHSGIKFDGLTVSIKKVQQYCDDIQDRRNGMFPYRPGQPGKQSLTGAGIIGLQLNGGAGFRDEILKGLGAIADGIKGKSWESANLYEWYYSTQATFQASGDRWSKWSDLLQSEIVRNQQPDGSWLNKTSKSQTPKEGDLFATTLCTLMLQAYYRYLPAGAKRPGS